MRWLEHSRMKIERRIAALPFEHKNVPGNYLPAQSEIEV